MDVHLPGIYVSKVIQSTEEKKIEKLTFAKDPIDNMLNAGRQFNHTVDLRMMAPNKTHQVLTTSF